MKRWLAEQWGSVGGWWVGATSALRSLFTWTVFGAPTAYKTTVDFNKARALYRNSDETVSLGGGFVRPIVDLAVEYVGLPYVTSDNGDRDTFINDAIHKFWADKIQECFRDSMRDSKTVIRFRQPNLQNKLATEDDRIHGKIDVIPPDTVDMTYDPTDPDLVIRAIVHHWIDWDERTQEEILRGQAPRIKEHHIIEVCTPEEYRWYDKTENEELTSWRSSNLYGFVPFIEIFNEFDAALGGGQSDIEPVYPFIQAFHDVLQQTLMAHKYHATPKAKFKVKDVQSFLRNNFPDVLDEGGKVKSGATIPWQGREILFMNIDEDLMFVEAQNGIDASKTLLDFLIDCISITAETPRWALLKESKVNNTDASVQPFEKKIERKRVMFQPFIQILCKMVLAARGQTPDIPRITWPVIRIESLVNKGQAIQQLIMGFDAAAAHEWIADETVVQILASIFPEMNAPEIERRLAASNVVPAPPEPAAIPASTNGSGDKNTAKKALTTVKASNS
jgi:hypothetical protein